MHYKVYRFIYLIVFLTIPFTLFGNEIQSIGVPYIQNYPKSAYQSGNQNWGIAKDKNGIMYFANNDGLLSFDGKYWQLHALPNRLIVRSVATANDGKVYTGGFSEFGYWNYEKGKLAYHSLTNLIPKNHKINSEIWKIYVLKDRIIFQAFNEIYIYQNNKIYIVNAGSSLLFLHQIKNKLFVEVLNQGLFELADKKLVFIAGSEVLKTGILSILPYKKDQYVIGTSKAGLYLFDGIKFTPFVTAANNFLKTYQLNNGVRIFDKYYAYGTILNGLIVIDEAGKIIQIINKSKGLQNNTILSLFVDQDQNLWAGLDNGIDRIELNSPLYFYFDKTGKFGTVYSSLIVGDKIYLGTNQGLYYSKWAPQNEGFTSVFDFSLIDGTQGQVWDLKLIDGQLICGHNDGTFRVIGNKVEKMSSVSGGWTIKKLTSNPNILIQGTYLGVAIYKKNLNGQWQFSNLIKGFSEPSRYVEQDSKGDVWVSHAYKGLYILTLSSDLQRATSVKYFDEKNGLPNNFKVSVFNVENKIVFSSDIGFYTYDEISNSFAKYEPLNKGLGSFASSNKIISAGYKKYWFINHGKMSLVDITQPGKIAVDSNRYSLLDGRMVQYYENISQISNNIYLISVDDGFVIYNTNNISKNTNQKLPLVLIRKLEDITDNYKIITETNNDNDEIEVKYSRNNIRISYALPYYKQTQVKYQYYLEGYSKQWSVWSSATQNDFTNLSSGGYKFKIRAKINDQTISETTVLAFTILPPWYASNWALAFYLILIVAGLVVGKKVYEAKLKKDQQKITDKLQLEQKEFLKKEAEATEKQITKLQTEKLQADLASKSRELANSAMTLVYKNELLQNLSEHISKLKDENGKKLADEQTRKIQKVIDEGMNDERDWNLFESSFNEAHESFFKKLKANHPDLVPNDIKLCAYLRMNMSSKEMASLLNITLRGVEIRRYRLRKKLNIPHDKNLTEFLIEL